MGGLWDRSFDKLRMTRSFFGFARGEKGIFHANTWLFLCLMPQGVLDVLHVYMDIKRHGHSFDYAQDRHSQVCTGWKPRLPRVFGGQAVLRLQR